MNVDPRRLVSTLALVALAAPSRPASAEDAVDDAAAEIRAVLDRQVERWNAADLDGFADTYWRSPELVFQSGGDRALGWDAMRERYRRRYEGEGKTMGRLEFRDLEVRPLDSRSGYAFGRWQLTMPDGSTPSGLFTVILRRRPEGWRIVHDHTSSASP